MRILWQPDAQRAQASFIAEFIQLVNTHTGLTLSGFRELHAWSVENYDLFWSLFCRFSGIIFRRESQQSAVRADHFINTRFFPGATINFAENLLRFAYNPEYSEKTALVSVLENDTVEELTWKQLAEKTAHLQKYLSRVDFGKSKTAAACLPNSSAAIISMLAATASGGAFSSASPDFGTEALLDRFGQTAPEALILCDGYFFKGKEIDVREKMLQVAKQVSSIKAIVVFDFIGKSIELIQAIRAQLPEILAASAADIFSDDEPGMPRFEEISFEDPVYIMFSSGTTGKPKCIVQGPGVLLNQVKEHLLHNDMRPTDRLLYYTTCGWMMWNWQAASLFCGNSLVLYDGNPFYPDNGRMFDLCRKHQVTVFGTSARYLQALQQSQFTFSDLTVQKQIRLLLSTGSPLPEETHIYAHEHLLPESQICSISGGTDLNGCFLLGNPLEPVVAGELQGPGLAMKISVFNETGQITEGEGELVCETPFPSMPLKFLQDEQNQKYLESYFSVFPGVWRHGDFIRRTERGGYIVSGRSDTTLNPGGVRIGTAEIYRAVETLPQIADSIVVGVPVPGDVAVVLFAVLSESGREADSGQTIQLIKNTIRAMLSPRHMPAAVFFVPEIPLTVNGKKSEIAVKNILSGRQVTNRDSLQNPDSLHYFESEKNNILKSVSAG